MGRPTELTSFRGDDDPRLVAAAIACRTCLSGEVDWSLEVGEWGDGQARCRCRSCGDSRTLSLTWDQALRLTLERERPLELA
ncbi:MAG: hypothetical protein ABR581_10220 [Thermoleophilaceae bacterium]